MSNQQQLMNK